MAMAKGARQRGVMIERKWQADALPLDRDHWEVTLTKMVEKGGNLVSDEQIVDHSRARRHGVRQPRAAHRAAMLGIKMPAIPVEHSSS